LRPHECSSWYISMCLSGYVDSSYFSNVMFFQIIRRWTSIIPSTKGCCMVDTSKVVLGCLVWVTSNLHSFVGITFIVSRKLTRLGLWLGERFSCSSFYFMHAFSTFNASISWAFFRFKVFISLYSSRRMVTSYHMVCQSFSTPW